ncbi:MAG: putative lipid II flippase FtsW [Chloroflexi bacterium]|nr:putative lipid II flippase FtsW [Chloroflexota bacterium]
MARPVDAAGRPRPTTREIAAGRTVKGPVRERHEADPWIIIATIALAATGVLMIYSAGAASLSSGSSDIARVLAPEMTWVTLGIVTMLTLSRLDYRWLRLVSVPLFLGAVALLVIVLGPAIGPIFPKEVNGSARWLGMFGSKADPLISFHPAEIAKLALVVYLAHWLARRGGSIGGMFTGTIPFLCIAGCVIALVALEPDLGTTGVITLTAFTMFFVAGASLWQLALMVPVGFAAVWTYINNTDYQLDRWNTFLDPWNAPAASAYHTVQGLLALGLGGTLGQGLGNSRQPGGLQLPNADNDFVFAMVGQELGLIGGSLVIGLFIFIAWRGIRVGLRAPDTFGGLLAIGISCWIAFQAFINIGVVVQLLPLTGITLPFVSTGNSSLLVSFAAVGILLSISRETQSAQSRGTTDDADPGRGRRHGRAHLPGIGGAGTPEPAPARP